MSKAESSAVQTGSGSPDDVVDRLIQTLREGATPAPPWFLTHRQRWRWLVDTLMGHPIIRGHQRPRDFPTDPASRRAISVAVDLHGCPTVAWWRYPTSDVSCPFGSWLHAFVLLVEGSVLPSTQDPEREVQVALHWLIWQTLRVAKTDRCEGTIQRIMAALGMTLKDAPSLTGSVDPKSMKDKNCPLGVHDAFGIAAEAAWVAGVRAARKDQVVCASDRHKSCVDTLLNTPLWILTLKTYKVQPYLERARTQWLARGASVWTSQALAIAREILLVRRTETEEPTCPDLMLLTDVDAVAEFVSFVEPDCGLIGSYLQGGLSEIWSLGQGGFHRLPRLRDIAVRLSGEPAAEELNLSTCLPSFIFDKKKLSIRSLYESMPWLNKEEQADQIKQRTKEGSLCVVSFPCPKGSKVQCQFVSGDRGLMDVGEVEWLDGKQGRPKIGWSGIVWSLAGATYRMQAVQGLGESLGFPGLALKLNHKEWLVSLDEPGSKVSYVKLDGDSVGKALGTMPKLEAISASLEILAKTYDGLISGTSAVISNWRENHERHEPSTLPVELVYLGGDDVMCNLPQHYVVDFLTGFERKAKSPGAVSFSGAVLTAPANLKDVGQKIPELVAVMVPRLLKWCKAQLKREEPEESMEELGRISFEKGFRLAAMTTSEKIGTLNVSYFNLEEPRDWETREGKTLVEEAEIYASKAHAAIGQLRKYMDDPYRNHLAEVASLVGKTKGCTEDMLAAAWLHDTLEDVPTVDLQELEVRFGTRVASLVLQLTDVSRATDGNRASRKAKDRDHLASASAEAQTIKLADLLVNADSILRYDRAFARVFLKEMGDLVDVLVDGDTELRDRAKAVVKDGGLHVQCL